MQLQLDKIVVGKTSYAATSNIYEQSGNSQGDKTARNTGIGAALGAIVGGITGGAKGAAIGAGAGAGGGVAVTAAGNADQVRIASETRLSFRLESPITVTIPTGK